MASLRAPVCKDFHAACEDGPELCTNKYCSDRVFLCKLALTPTRGSRGCLPYFRSSVSIVLFLPLASAAMSSCERVKWINLSPPGYVSFAEELRPYTK